MFNFITHHLKSIKAKKVLEQDLFLKRIRSGVIGESMLSDHNIALIDYAIRKMPQEGVVLEIGSYAGLSTNVILHLLNKHSQMHRMYCVDAWRYEGYEDNKLSYETEFIDGRDDVLRTDYTVYIQNAFRSAVKLFHATRMPYAYHQNSAAFFANWNKKEMTDVFGRNMMPEGKIAFCYIDGDHSYSSAKEDYENTIKHMLPDGYILLDDTEAHLKFGSVRLRKEIMKDTRVNIISSQKNLLIRFKK